MRRLHLLALLTIGMTASCFADTITADGTYWEFIGFTVGTPVSPCNGGCLPSINPAGIEYTAMTPWTFVGPGNLLVLDLFLSGDQYEVFDNNVSLGLTSAVPGTEVQCGLPALADITCSLNSALFSRGNYQMGAGSHSITVNYIRTTSVNHSGAAIQLTAVPEPSSFMFIAMGLLVAVLRK
jgi:PEP-CTERM motif